VHTSDLLRQVLLQGYSQESQAFRTKLIDNPDGGSLEGEIRATSVTVGNTPTPLPETPLKKRQVLLIYNNSGRTVYIGGAGVTVQSGTPLKRDKFFPQLDVSEDVIICAVADKGQNDLRIIEGS